MKVINSDKLFQQMKEGHVYRRDELCAFSKSVDRELWQLVSKQKIRKAGAGLYYRPKVSKFGELSPEKHDVVRAFLGTDDFLLMSLNYFNGLAVGLTQLTNETLVYNRKRFGKFKLAGMAYNFLRPLNYPKAKQVNEEYLFVDLLNHYNNVHEPPEFFDSSLKRKAKELRKEELFKLADLYGKERAKRKLEELINND